MNWGKLLEQQNLSELRRNIKSDSTSWASFDDSELMNSFLERILSFNNEKDISFKRECISFIKEVFPRSSNKIRGCFLSSPIMNGVYDLFKEGQYYEEFNTIIEYANQVGEWWDLKSGLALLGNGHLTTKTFGSLFSLVSEIELTEYIEKGLIQGELLNSFLSSKDEWGNWKLAEKIIRKAPDSLYNKCFVNLATKQPDSVILSLREELGLNKELVRLIVLQKGFLDDWDSALGYLSCDIVLSSDSIFKSIAAKQNCEELLSLYDREFIEGEDLKDIISIKGYWDDLNSVERLLNDGIISIPEEQIVLSALNSGRSSVLDELLTDRGLLLSTIEFWKSHKKLCPNFTSLCWAHLRDSILQSYLEDSVKHDYSEQVEAISKLSNVVSIEAFMLSIFASFGQSYTAGFSKALADGTLVPPTFFDQYRQLTSEKEYTSLHQFATFKKRYSKSLQILRATKMLGLLSLSNKQRLRTITEDILAEDKTVVRKFNKQYFKYIDAYAHSLFGEFEDTYNELNREQKEAVLTDEDSYLVISSAGSGKTRVIVSKYRYLTQIKGVKKEAVRILAYTKATRKEINEKKLGMDPEKGAARTFHSFANEVIDLSGLPKEFLKDVQESARKGEVDHSPRAAILFSKMINDGIESNEAFMNAMSLYAMSYKAKDKNQNLSFYTDRNGKIGSLKSYQEKVIFDFLADNSIDFAYEELSNDKKATPDFTIYYNGEWIYYEHFAVDQNESSSPYGQKYLADFNRKKEQWGEKLVYTKGANVVDTEEILDQLKSILVEELGIQLQPIDAEERTAIFKKKENYQEIFQSGIKMCLDVYDIIRESRIPQEEAFSRCKTVDYANTFMTVLYATVMRYYLTLLDPKNNGGKRVVDYTGCIEYAMELCRDRKLKTIQWDYILIDEYQDISPLRYEFIKSLLKVNPKLKVLAVGDDWQSIYSFANSDLTHFKDFENDWQYSLLLKMTETFRFNDPLLSVSSSFLKNGKDPLLIDKEVKPSKTAPKKTELEVKECNNYRHQIEFIKRIIHDKGLSADDYLILARYKADLTRIRNIISQELPNSYNSDCFMTMHSSKGLTKDYVFILNCNEGVLPSQVQDDTVIRLIRQSTDRDKMNEERRLFYVAITRASKKTFVLYSGTPSIFVSELDTWL